MDSVGSRASQLAAHHLALGEGICAMRKLLFVAGLCAVAPGCGSSNSDLVAACNTFASVGCKNACVCLGSFYCASCTGPSETTLGCATAECPTGMSFYSPAATTCIHDLNAESCTDVLNNVTPVTCSAVFCPGGGFCIEAVFCR